MVIPLEELARLVALVDSINNTSPELLRYSFSGNIMANESRLSNFDYGRELIKFIAAAAPPTGELS